MKIVKEQKNPDLTTLGGRIEYLRREKRLTQDELAKNIDITREKLNYIEKNTKGRNLNLNEFIKLSEELNVSSDYLLGFVKSNNTNNINFIKQTGLDDLSIHLLTNITKEKKNNTFNYFLQNLNIENILEQIEQDLTVKYLSTELLEKPFSNMEKNYKNKINNIIDEEDLSKIEIFILNIRNICENPLPQYSSLSELLNKYHKQIDTINKIYINLNDYNRTWDYKDTYNKIDFKAYKDLYKVLNSYNDYILYNIVENSLKDSIKKLEESIDNKNLHIELNILNK